MSQSASLHHSRGHAPARSAAPAAARHESAVKAAGRAVVAPYVWAATRVALGAIFLWAFLDKLFGLGYATPSEASWINGGSPTEGFLAHATGPFDGIYHDIAGAGVVDLLFMAGLAGVGIALIAGVAMRPAAASGALMMVLMWTASLPLETNPVLDDHIIYALVLIGLAASRAGDTLGLGKQWSKLGFVQRMPWMR